MALCGAAFAADNKATVVKKATVPVPLGLLPVDWPADNMYSSEKAELGRLLYFDKPLSKDNSISCASCHSPEHAYTDGAEKIKPLKLTDQQKQDLVESLKSLNSQGWQKVTPPASFPQ